MIRWFEVGNAWLRLQLDRYGFSIRFGWISRFAVNFSVERLGHLGHAEDDWHYIEDVEATQSHFGD